MSSSIKATLRNICNHSVPAKQQCSKCSQTPQRVFLKMMIFKNTDADLNYLYLIFNCLYSTSPQKETLHNTKQETVTKTLSTARCKNIRTLKSSEKSPPNKWVFRKVLNMSNESLLRRSERSEFQSRALGEVRIF